MFTQTALIAETEKLQKFAFRLTRNKDDADDLLQATCLRALEKADYFEGGSNLFSWTSKIMYNLFISSYRRRTKFETQFDPEIYINKQSVAPSQHIDAEFADVRRAMMKLSADHRDVLISVCIKGMRYDETSRKLQIPVGTVRSRLSRAREQLCALMDTPIVKVSTPETAKRKTANTNVSVVPAYIIAARAQQRMAL